MLTLALLTPAELQLVQSASSGVTLDAIAQEIHTMSQTVQDQIASTNARVSGLATSLSDYEAQVGDLVKRYQADEIDKTALVAELTTLQQQLGSAASGVTSAAANLPAPPAPAAPAAPPAVSTPSAGV